MMTLKGASAPVADILGASVRGDVAVIRRLLRKRRRTALSAAGPDGCTPLLLSCKHGHLEVAQMLVTAGANPEDRDRDPKRQGNALHYAAWGGHITLVRWLIDNGSSPAEVDVVGNTALLYAVYGGHRPVVEELLRRGRSLQERNSKNHTALLQAACGGHLDLVKWLLRDHGFTLDDADHDGNTSLLFAAWGGHLQLIHYLLANGSSLDEQNNNGHSIFLSAANGGRVEIVEWLLNKGFSLQETNNNGDTALLLAAYGGHRALVERLLELGGSLDDRNGCGFTPLLSAANGGQLEMSKWLLENGSSLTEVDNDGYTSLILAACGGNIELVEFFIANGAKLTEQNDNGDTALLLAAYCGHRALVAWLLDNGSSLHEHNNTRMGVLISAANGGSVEVVELLLERIAAAAPDCRDAIESTDEGGYTPLLLAAQRGHLEVVQLLAAYGANLHARTSRHDNNAISLAVDFPEVQRYLETVWDWSPIQIATDCRMVDRVHALVQAGAEIAPNAYPEGESPLELAHATQAYRNARAPVRELVLMLRKARLPWSPKRYALFSYEFRRLCYNIRVLQCQLAKEGNLPIMPDEVWLHITSLVQRSWFFPEGQTAAVQVGWVEPSSPSDRFAWRQRELLNEEPDIWSDAEGDEILEEIEDTEDTAALAATDSAAAAAAATAEDGAEAALAAAAPVAEMSDADDDTDEAEAEADTEAGPAKSLRARNSTSQLSAAVGPVADEASAGWKERHPAAAAAAAAAAGAAAAVAETVVAERSDAQQGWV